MHIAYLIGVNFTKVRKLTFVKFTPPFRIIKLIYNWHDKKIKLGIDVLQVKIKLRLNIHQSLNHVYRI
jgi:hypothetical protein